MKFSVLLSSILSLFLLSFAPGIDVDPPIKFTLIIKGGSKNAETAEKIITSSFSDLGISSRFDYFIQESTKKDEYPYPVTDIFHEEDKLGTIYGMPNKDFLLQILPSLEDQVISLEKSRGSN